MFLACHTPVFSGGDRSMRGFSVIVSQPENAKEIKIIEMVEIPASLVTQSWRAENLFFQLLTGELSNIHISERINKST
jgi:hypothetical protein